MNHGYVKPRKRIKRLEMRQAAYERQDVVYQRACKKPGSLNK